MKSASKFDGDDLLDTIRLQQEQDMLELESKAFAKMTQAEKDALRRYTGSSYEEMNSYLRYMQQGLSTEDAIRLSGISDEGIKNVDLAIKGLSKAKLEKDLVLRRGTDLGDLAGMLPGNFSDNLAELNAMSIEQLNAQLSGKVGVYAGFTSTSSIWTRGFRGKVEMIISAPKGTQASSIMGISQFGTGEGETLLNAGTKVIIKKIEASDGHKDSDIRVFVEIIGNIHG